MEMAFYKCSVCGQIIGIIKDTNMPLICCGKKMEEMIPGTTDALSEMHVPVITVEGDNVTVCIGSAPHPMTTVHHIEWIALETSCGNQRKELKWDAEPMVCFRLCKGETVKCAYAYCNLHGLWKANSQYAAFSENCEPIL